MSIWLWIGFIAVVLLLLAMDLGVFNRTPHAISVREALGWTAFWISLALAFNALIFVMYENHWLGIGLELGYAMSGGEAALKFFTAFVVEKSLSLDNIFVIAMIFGYFGVPAQFQHRVLFWGVIGAIAMRGIMIWAGIAVIGRFTWLIYVFGGLLIATAVKMLIVRHDSIEPDKNPAIRLIRRLYPVTDGFRGEHFFITESGKRFVTPLGLALVLVETADLLFAVDSIPAVFAVTLDPFIVFTSNVFAILGLRSLYFALAGVMERFRYLKMSLVFILAFVGAKMILTHHYPIPTPVSLLFIVVILSVGVAASVLAGHRDSASLPSPLGDELEAFARTTVRTVRRIMILIAGSTLLLVGAALLVLPGPGILIGLGGLALLATEFVWARVWMRRVREKMDEVARDARRLAKWKDKKGLGDRG